MYANYTVPLNIAEYYVHCVSTITSLSIVHTNCNHLSNFRNISGILLVAHENFNISTFTIGYFYSHFETREIHRCTADDTTMLLSAMISKNILRLKTGGVYRLQIADPSVVQTSCLQ